MEVADRTASNQETPFMSISTVTQTLATPYVPPASAASSAPATSFSVGATATATTGAGAVQNPIGSISSDLQNYLLQQSQGTDGQTVKGHHHHHHGGGSQVDAPALPGSSTPAVTA